MMLLRTELYLFKSLHYCEISAAKHIGIVAECHKTSECILGLENAASIFVNRIGKLLCFQVMSTF